MGPNGGSGFYSGSWKVVVTKRYHRAGDGRPYGEENLQYVGQELSQPDNSNFFNVSVDARFVVKDYRGEVVYGPRPLTVNSWFGQGQYLWAYELGMFENALCETDRLQCKQSVAVTVDLTYDDPETGALRTDSHAFTRYLNRGLYDPTFKGVFSDRSTPSTTEAYGNSMVRVTLVDAGIQFDARSDQGTFGITADTAYFKVEGTGLPGTAGSCSLPNRRAHCSLARCADATRVMDFDFADYRGPIVVERHAGRYLVNPQVFTKVGPSLHLVY